MSSPRHSTTIRPDSSAIRVGARSGCPQGATSRSDLAHGREPASILTIRCGDAVTTTAPGAPSSATTSTGRPRVATRWITRPDHRSAIMTARPADSVTYRRSRLSTATPVGCRSPPGQLIVGASGLVVTSMVPASGWERQARHQRSWARPAAHPATVACGGSHRSSMASHRDLIGSGVQSRPTPPPGSRRVCSWAHRAHWSSSASRAIPRSPYISRPPEAEARAPAVRDRARALHPDPSAHRGRRRWRRPPGAATTAAESSPARRCSAEPCRWRG